MKTKTFTLLFFLIYFATSGNTQIKEKKNKSTPSIISSLSLDLQQQNINFNFIWFNDYVNGLGSYEGIYSSKAQIISNINWKLSCKAKDKFIHSDGRTKIALNNIGISVFCKNMDGKVNKTLNSPLPLSKGNKTLLSYKEKNKTSSKNSKVEDSDKETITDDISIFWEMGTKKGKMNKKNLHQQNLKKGNYSVDIEFILTEKL